jgi:hypothetical protein
MSIRSLLKRRNMATTSASRFFVRAIFLSRDPFPVALSQFFLKYFFLLPHVYALPAAENNNKK